MSNVRELEGNILPLLQQCDKKKFDKDFDEIFGKKDYVKEMVDSAIAKIDSLSIDELETEFKSFDISVKRKSDEEELERVVGLDDFQD